MDQQNLPQPTDSWVDAAGQEEKAAQVGKAPTKLPEGPNPLSASQTQRVQALLDPIIFVVNEYNSNDDTTVLDDRLGRIFDDSKEHIERSKDAFQQASHCFTLHSVANMAASKYATAANEVEDKLSPEVVDLLDEIFTARLFGYFALPTFTLNIEDHAIMNENIVPEAQSDVQKSVPHCHQGR